MWLIVGLGNPGKRYERTRHNAGFMVIDRLAKELEIVMRRSECYALVASAVLEGHEVRLVKPQTFMNLSGQAVACLAKKYTISPQEVLVVVDDFALPLGKLRIRRRGSDGGHNGLKSLIAEIGTTDFPRVRLGIQPEEGQIDDPVNFVLSNFDKEESEVVDQLIDQAVAAIKTILREGVEQAMTKFN
jgi:PTH1 family peptidyl-tRNA hydrolase